MYGACPGSPFISFYMLFSFLFWSAGRGPTAGGVPVRSNFSMPDQPVLGLRRTLSPVVTHSTETLKLFVDGEATRNGLSPTTFRTSTFKRQAGLGTGLFGFQIGPVSRQEIVDSGGLSGPNPVQNPSKVVGC